MGHIYTEIENRIIQMTDLKAVREIPFPELVEQIDVVVRELARRNSYSLSGTAHLRLAEVIAADLVKRGQMAAA